MSFEKPSRATIRTHRGGSLGQAVVTYKQAWKKVLGPVLDSILEFEREQLLRAMTARMDGLFQVLDRRLGALEADLIALSERVGRLERDTGLEDDVRLTNAAVLEGREKLAQLQAEIDRVRGELASATRAADTKNGVSGSGD